MLLTTRQAATRLGISPRRVAALILAGRLPAQKIGRDWLIEENALALVLTRPPGNRSGRPRVKHSSDHDATT